MRESSHPFLVPFLSAMLCLCVTTRASSQVEPALKDASTRRFEVVSIRPSGSSVSPHFVILPDGYEAIAVPLVNTLFLAYVKAPYFKHLDELKGVPSWVSSEKYDLRAKLAPTDVAEWQRLHQSIMRTPMLLQDMLRLVLAERCKLRIHSTEVMTDGYALRVRANAPAFQEDSSLPVGDQGIELLDGARAIPSMQKGEQVYTFYNTTMDALATFISLSSQHAIEDRTGLRGRYKLVLHRITPLPSDQSTAPELDMPVPWDLRALGMKVEGEKVKATIWVVDSIEKPTAN